MSRIKYLSVLLTLVFVGAGYSAVSAQYAPVTGKVELKKADGTSVPISGALVEVFRQDQKGSLPSAKTGKKGEFSFAGIPFGNPFILSVSAQGASPNFLANVRAGQERITIFLAEGDGKRFTEDEVKGILANAAPAAAGTPKGLTDEEKKAQAEYEAKVKEVQAKNEKAEQNNALIQKALNEGNDAFTAKNYTLAVAKYDEGIAADPNFVGSAPVLLNNRGVALKMRGIDSYNAGVKASDPAVKAENIGKAKKDLEESLNSYDRSWGILKSAPPTDILDKANYDKAKYDALAGLTELYRLLVITKTNVSKGAEAKAAFDAYLAVETDAAKKAKAQISYGDVMLESGESESALAAYKVALETAPDNPDALAGIGFSLVNLGYVNNDKAQLQDGANYLQKFAGIAPENHKFKADAVALIDTLKKEQNVTPQKTTSSKKKN